MARFRFSRYWLFQFAGWGTFALINTFFAYYHDKLRDDQDVQIFFGRMGIFIVLGLLATHLMRFAIIRLNILQRSFDKQIIQFSFLTLCFSLLASFFNIHLLSYFGWLNASEKLLLNKTTLLPILTGAFVIFVYFLIWNLIYFMYHYVTKSQKQQLDTLKLESLVRGLELQTIKAHINPHFIFNALNSIRALIDENPERARDAVTHLAKILRNSMTRERDETVRFKQELDIVKDYLALENMRFEDRLQVEYDVDEETLNQLVPPMMLQTLVENAIKHGISRQMKGGVVRIISDLNNDYHLLSVQNTGYLNGTTNKEGFGLSSTEHRLQLLYGEKAKFEIKQIDPSLVEAKVLIPVSLN
jgi:sensor histidine kinase YesM